MRNLTTFAHALESKRLAYRLLHAPLCSVAESIAQTKPKTLPRPVHIPPKTAFSRPYPGTRAPHRPYKPKMSRGRPQNHNMSLTNGRKPMQSVYPLLIEQPCLFSCVTRVGRRSMKSVKYSDKQCSRFSTTGALILSRRNVYPRALFVR